ncbi:MAG: cobalamin 5'-phosphate synthase [Lentisphaerae bacterium RIFOXYC12_FULL_60_16]|nr:MAG: cobalamin 5'-phosphate synthase [Lentisphaerae bacterium RIFOXYC12_FULL_60_16]
MINSLVTALRTLTIVPVPGQETKRFADALPWFPLVGLLIGLAVVAVIRAAGWIGLYTWPAGTAILALVTGIALTGGLHLDGLADWADGFWGGKDRESALRIMKDPRIGSFGGIALVLVLLTRWACLTRIISHGGTAWILAAAMLSRFMQVDLACSRPYARADGGTAAPFIEGAGRRQWLLAMAGMLTGLMVLSLHNPFIGLSVIPCWIGNRLFGEWCQRRVGGITGDLLGTASELIETAVLWFGAVQGPIA